MLPGSKEATISGCGWDRVVSHKLGVNKQEEIVTKRERESIREEVCVTWIERSDDRLLKSHVKGV